MPGRPGIHTQVTVSVGERRTEVDVRLAPLVAELWKADIDTSMSCERHLVTQKVWIGFSTAADAEQFLNIIATYGKPAKWARQTQWYFGEFEKTAMSLGDSGQATHPADWEFYASVYDDSLYEEPRASALGSTFCSPAVT